MCNVSIQHSLKCDKFLSKFYNLKRKIGDIMDKQKNISVSRVNKVFIFNHSLNYGGDLDDIVEYYDLTFVLKGALTYIINGEEVVVCKNTAVLFPNGSHRIRIGTASPDIEYISFNFTVDSPLKLPRVIENCLTEDITALLKLAENTYTGHSFHREETLMMIFQSLLFTLDDIISVNKLNPHIEKILSYIDSHYTEKITLEPIAELVHLAPSYCSNLIKKELGMTISDIVTAKRMELARNLMFAKQKNMIEIAHTCGYNHYGYFLKCFKKRYGYIPSDID